LLTGRASFLFQGRRDYRFPNEWPSSARTRRGGSRGRIGIRLRPGFCAWSRDAGSAQMVLSSRRIAHANAD